MKCAATISGIACATVIATFNILSNRGARNATLVAFSLFVPLERRGIRLTSDKGGYKCHLITLSATALTGSHWSWL